MRVLDWDWADASREISHESLVKFLRFVYSKFLHDSKNMNGKSSLTEITNMSHCITLVTAVCIPPALRNIKRTVMRPTLEFSYHGQAMSYNHITFHHRTNKQGWLTFSYRNQKWGIQTQLVIYARHTRALWIVSYSPKCLNMNVSLTYSSSSAYVYEIFITNTERLIYELVMVYRYP